MPPKRKMDDHVDFDFRSDESEQDDLDLPVHSTSAPRHTTQFLEETTVVSVDGTMHHSSHLLEVPASPPASREETRLRPDVEAPGPVFDHLDTPDDDLPEYEDEDEEGRALHQSVGAFDDFFCSYLLICFLGRSAGSMGAEPPRGIPPNSSTA